MSDTYVISASGAATILKDPEALLDYIFDWTAYLAAISDTLTAINFTVTSGTIAASGFVGALATAWVSGGVAGTTITLTCHITTAGGRQDDRSVFLKIRER